MLFVLILIAGILSFLVCYLVCIVLFTALNRSLLKLFDPMQKLISNLKGKKLISGTILVAMCIFISYLKLNDVYCGLLLGLFASFHYMIFSSPINAEK